MTEVQIPWVEGAKYFKVLCRLGINKPDIVDDDDRYPNLTSQGGTVEITSAVNKFRYTEPDGRSRMVYTVKETYRIQPSTGELEDVDGNVGVFLLDTSSPGVDPPNFTYTATVRPAMGEAFPVTIPGSPGSEVVDLVAHASVSPSTGDPTIESRVAMLEQQVSSGGGVDAEAVQDIVGAMVTGAGGTYDDVEGTVTLPSGAVSSVAGRTGVIDLSSADLTDVASLATDDELASGLDGKADMSHTHLAENITDWAEAVQDTVAAMLVSGANVTLVYDDAAGKVVVTAAGGDAEAMRDTIGAALVGVNGVSVAINDAADTITLSISGLTSTQISDSTAVGRSVLTAANAAAARAAISAAPALGADDNYVTDAEKAKLADLSGTNTGDQDLSGYVQTTNAPELIRDTIGSTLVAGTNVTITPDDANDTITIAASGGGGGVDAEQIQDVIGAMIVGGVYDDASGTLSVSPPIMDVQLIVSRRNDVTLASKAFTTFPFNYIDLNLGGGSFDTGNGVYTVPKDGLYLCLGAVRIKDHSEVRSTAIGIGTANADAPFVSWDDMGINRVNGRSGRQYFRLARFSAGDLVRLYIYSDDITFPVDANNDAPYTADGNYLAIVRIGE